jgi:hypothetical protein
MDKIITIIFSQYCLIVLFVLGAISLTLNTLIFTRKTFRYNSCVHYFLASTIANYFVIFLILPSRVLSDGFQIDPGRYNLLYCKLRFYTYFTAKSLSSWFIVLACFDRKMSSSPDVHRRAFARLTMSRTMIISTTVIGLLFYAHILVFYEITPQGNCDAREGFYRLFNDGIYLIGYSIVPPFFMLFFGVWTINNTRRLRRIAPRFGRRISSLNHRDHALMLMLFLQVLLITLTAVPHAVQKLYSSITIDMPKSQSSKTAENIFVIVVRTISFFNHSCTFYILTLSGRLFRQELGKILTSFACTTRSSRQSLDQQLRTMTPTVKITGNDHPIRV